MFVTLAIILLLVLFFIYSIIMTSINGQKNYQSYLEIQVLAFFSMPVILVDLTVDFLKYISS